ncbi:MAG: WecB/TagA/CpsF family glycosyltransferase [Leptolyngbyaceae cyanobacterium MO_188.B28]|nr:WecB/TagA/CpsF family glycosyltransferase [Leptolyngbyaceae cyanobacterium MO_188.B28]
MSLSKFNVTDSVAIVSPPNEPIENPPTINVIDSPLTALPFHEQIELMLHWANQNLSKVVCVANVHMLMEATWHEDLGAVLKSADLVTPDGMPLVWMMNLLGARTQDRVAGMDILLTLCQAASSQDCSIFFVGSTTETLERMRLGLKSDFPNLQIAGMEPLPFRPLTPSEDKALIAKINQSGAGLLMVCLGCPKQERWMAEHKNKIQAVMIGLGGAFPVYAGIQRRAPLLVRRAGLEWLYRLIQEPQRLWGRYRKTIPPFVWLALKQLLRKQRWT